MTSKWVENRCLYQQEPIWDQATKDLVQLREVYLAEDVARMVEALRNVLAFADKWTPQHVYQPGIPKALWDATEILEEFDGKQALAPAQPGKE